MRILIADDHPVVSAGLAALVARHGETVVLVATIDDAEAALRQSDFDLCLLGLDFGAGARNGFNFLPVARQLQPDLRILIVSMYGDESLIARARALGASGFITKAAPESELVAAACTVAGGDNSFAAPTTPHPDFSPGELEVVGLLASDQSRKQIAAACRLSIAMVDLHLRSIGDKLEVRGLPAVRAEIARRALHLLPPPPPKTPPGKWGMPFLAVDHQGRYAERCSSGAGRQPGPRDHRGRLCRRRPWAGAGARPLRRSAAEAGPARPGSRRAAIASIMKGPSTWSTDVRSGRNQDRHRAQHQGGVAPTLRGPGDGHHPCRAATGASVRGH